MFGGLFNFGLFRGSRWRRGGRHGAARPRPSSYRPEVVELESRTLLSTINWLRPVSGDWDTAANWAGGHVPGASDTAVIPFRGITVTHATAADDRASNLNSEAALDISAGSLTIDAGADGTSRLDALVTVNGGTLSFFNSSVDGRGALRNFATLNLGNSRGETFAGDVSVAVDNEAGVLTVFGAINNDAARPFVNGPSATLRIAPVRVGSAIFANGFTNQGHIEVMQNLFVASGTLVNAPGATIDLSGGITASLDNQGTIATSVGGIGKTGGTVSNEGTITVNNSAGFLSVVADSFEQDGTVTGSGTLNIETTTADFLSHAVNGVANLQVFSSTLTSATALTNLVSIGGSTINAAVVNQRTLTVRNGFAFGDVTSTINGPLTNAAGASLVLRESNLTVTQGVTNNGSIVLSSGTFLETGIAALTVTGGTLTNAAGAAITVPDSSVGANLLSAALENQGTLTVMADTVLTGSVTNSGTINVRPGAFGAGDLTVNLTNPSAPITNNGTIAIAGLRALIVQGGSFANAGTVTVGSFGTLLVIGNYAQTAGLTSLSGGVMTADGLVDLEGGVLAGTGVINANIRNNAELDVGQPGSPGILTIVGDYTQTSGGVLVIEIGGANAGSDFDQLNITGQATLDGALTVHLINGFQPNGGDRFPIMTFGSGSGTFATVNADGTVFTPSFDSGDVTLVGN
jgi:fibronectin-binding autotransporter adhesin